jgi:hypothetical protein
MIYGDGCGATGGMNEWQGKLKYSEETCPSAALPTTEKTLPDQGSNLGHHGRKLATNCLSYSTSK